MMSPDDRVIALRQMEMAVSNFYSVAVQIGNHPFIEFADLMTRYVKACRLAHEKDIDFSECSIHTDQLLMANWNVFIQAISTTAEVPKIK